MILMLIKFETTRMKTRSQIDNVEVVEMVEVSGEFESEKTIIDDDVIVVSLPEATLIPKALRRVEQNAQATVRLSVVRDAVKELKRSGQRMEAVQSTAILKRF